MTRHSIRVQGNSHEEGAHVGVTLQAGYRFPSQAYADRWQKQIYDPSAYWGGFSREEASPDKMWRDAPWALGPFAKHAANPVLAPSPGGWDTGRMDGGVHNGAIVVRDGLFYYVYRGERPLDVAMKSDFDYICDIGV